jgi:mono/diheme cytochrome c family protein
MRRPVLLVSLLATLAVACGSDDSGGGTPDAAAPVPDAGGADATVYPDDPFAPLPDTSEGLTNVSADLNAVLENGALAGACDAYAADPTNRRKRLLCGKSQFFYESFGTAGVPKPLVTWLIANFPDEVGPGFSALGMVADPTSAEHLPLGLGLGPKLGTVDTLSFTCASCHFARLPDGRYAVGAPNHAYAYGQMNLDIAVLTALSVPGADPSQHDADAVAAVQPLRDRMAAHPEIGTALLQALLPLISGGGAAQPTFSAMNEHHYAHWRTGTMDFLIEPLPMDDGVHTISKISSLWSLPSGDELAARGITSAQLGWTGGTQSLLHFMRGFVDLGGGTIADWPDDRLGPVMDYVYSLRAPANPSPPDAMAAARGATTFGASCLSCHDGPRGMGQRPYDFTDIGTDDAMKWWADGADHDGQPCCGLHFYDGDSITHQIKSPRLVGLWAMTRFLHNGSLDSLDQLLCLAPRAGVTEPAFGDAGHTYGCELPEADRRDLEAFLLSH